MSDTDLKNDGPATREMHLKRKAMWDASMQNHAAYLDAESQLFASEFVEERACPACGGSNERFLFYKSGGTYVGCNSCQMVYLNPVFKDEVLERYYRTNHQLQGATVAADLGFYAGLYKKGLQEIERVVGAQGRILDVGCSTGSFLDIAQAAGWHTSGLELNHVEAQEAKAKGHAVQEQLLAAASFDERFEAISLWDVFEHIKDGLGFLQKAKPLLSENGVVFVQSPSRDSLAARILQEKCNMFDGLEHVNLFGVDSINSLCARAGYELVSYETVISEIGVINNHLGYEDPYLGHGRNSKTLLGEIDEAWIHEKKIGYKFQVCLRPR